jgi:HKD family nuclease
LFASAYCSWRQGSLLDSPLKHLDKITAILASVDDGGQDDPRTGFGELASAMKYDGKEVHIHEFQQPPRFHPKLYVFRRMDRNDKNGALIVGSSNFTQAAFSYNEELDVLLEGTLEGDQFDNLRERFNGWMNSSTCLTKQCHSK